MTTEPNDQPAAFNLTRRDMMLLLGGGALTTALPACTASQRPGTSRELSDPLYNSSVNAIAAAIARGDISSEEIVTACLDRIDDVNPALNAVVQLDRAGALARASEADAARARGENWGPLHGVPMTIKDSFDTAGMISTGGTLGRKDYVPDADATAVARVKNAGAILMGKTNTPELTLSFETDNLIYGRTNNPYDLSKTSGGSSGGAAAIVAAGGSPFDIGSDYGGSIRLPAHFNGIAGIKPTHGRVSRAGHIFPFGGTHDSYQQIGPLARYVDDLTLILPIIMGPDGIDPALVPMPWSDPASVDVSGLRVAVHTDNGIFTPTAETQAAVRAAADMLAAAGATVTEAVPTGIEESFEIMFGVFAADGGAAVARLLEQWGTTQSTLAPLQPPLLQPELDRLFARWYQLRSDMTAFFADYDLILCPVNGGPAHDHGQTVNDLAVLARFSYTATYNATGWPGAVVRGGTSPGGLPIGVQCVAHPGRENIALAAARVVEAATGGFQPPVL